MASGDAGDGLVGDRDGVPRLMIRVACPANCLEEPVDDEVSPSLTWIIVFNAWLICERGRQGLRRRSCLPG